MWSGSAYNSLAEHRDGTVVDRSFRLLPGVLVAAVCARAQRRMGGSERRTTWAWLDRALGTAPPDGDAPALRASFAA